MSFLLALALALGQDAASDPDKWRALLRDGQEVEALAAVRASAATGDAEGLDFLGWFYDEGRGGAPHHRAKAADAYRRAAEAGNKHAQWRYGVMLDTGEGVPADSKHALAWFEKSAAQGFTNAIVSLGVMYSNGRAVPQDHARAMAYYREAAKRRNLFAFAQIGVIYAQGEGVPADPIEAMAWFMIGATSGDRRAAQLLQDIGRDRDDTQLSRAADRANAISKELGLAE